MSLRLAGLGLLIAILAAPPVFGEGLSTADFFRPSEFQRALMSPTGEFVVTLRSVDGWLRVEIVDPKRDVSLSVLRAEEILEPHVGRLVWLDADSLALSYRIDHVASDMEVDDEHLLRNLIVDVKQRNGKLARKWIEATIEGTIVQPLPLDDAFLLFSPAKKPGELHRIRPADLTEPIPDSDTGLPAGSLVAAFDDRVLRWICDPDGTPRVVVTVEKHGKWRVRHRYSSDERWNTVLSGRPGLAELEIFPVALSEDGRQIIVASGSDEGTLSLREFDPRSRELGKVIFERPVGDFDDVILDHSRSRVRGISFFEAGRRKYQYFNKADRVRSEKLEALFPGKFTTVEDATPDGGKLVVRVTTPDDPGAAWYVDLESGFQRELGQIAPWLAADSLAKVETFRVDSKDGRSVEAIIALPRNLKEKAPLVVFPHGGPIGVMNEVEFNPQVQALANGGFAVLQVNFRGSGGYGEEFQRAGERQWGRGIEDDIDAAVEYVIEREWVNPNQMCVAGASYGGYSALMSVIRHPKRFRCAATLAGVTDIPLILNSTDSAITAASRARWHEIVGDPRTDYEKMKAVSPVYRVAEIEVPLLLAHGSEDTRVHIEHTNRLRLMLEAHGKPYEWYPLEGMGHQFNDPDEQIAYYAKLKNFLSEHLTQPPESPDPAGPTTAQPRHPPEGTGP